jgi:opacity protein-like surface antigen
MRGRLHNRVVTAVATVAFLSIAARAHAQAQPPAPTKPSEDPSANASLDEVPAGIELGARLGYGVALGNVSGAAGDSLGDYVNGVVPIWIEAGYRLPHPNLTIGAYFQYGAGMVNSSSANGLSGFIQGGNCTSSGVSCSANLVMYGLQAHYHFMPGARFDPWIGGGFGMESLNASISAGSSSVGASLSAFDFLIVQAGGDFQPSRSFGVGPAAWLGLGQFGNLSVTHNGTTSSGGINNTSIHEWLSLGLRGVFDFDVAR